MNIAHNEVEEAHALRAILLGEVDFFVDRWQGIHKHIVFLEVYPQICPHLSDICRHLSGAPLLQSNSRMRVLLNSYPCSKMSTVDCTIRNIVVQDKIYLCQQEVDYES